MRKIYSLLSKILPLAVTVLSLALLAFVALSGFKFGFMSLSIDKIKELFGNIKEYFNPTFGVENIINVIFFIGFTVVEVVLVIIMLVKVITMLVSSLVLLGSKKEVGDNKKAVNKVLKKGSGVSGLALTLFILHRVLTGTTAKFTILVIVIATLLFAVASVFTVLFDKLLGETEKSWLDVITLIVKRVVAYVACLVIALNLTHFKVLFGNVMTTLSGGTGSRMEPIMGVMAGVSMILYLVIVIFAVKGLSFLMNNVIEPKKKKNPYRKLFVLSIIGIIFALGSLFGYTSFIKGEVGFDAGLFFNKGLDMFLVPLLCVVSLMVIFFDKDKKKKREEIAENQ